MRRAILIQACHLFFLHFPYGIHAIVTTKHFLSISRVTFYPRSDHMDANSKPSKARLNVLVQRQKHRGTSFVNTTTTTTVKATCYTNSSSSDIRFKPQKKLQSRTPSTPIRNSDLRAVQKGSHKRIAPKSRQSSRVCGSAVVPYQDIIDLDTNISFSFELIKYWARENEMQNNYLPSPTGPVIPDWALHGLPPGIPDEGKQCFHAYLFSCPIRQYPLEQLRIVSWQPLAMDQSRFERLMLQPLTLRCTLSMGALFLLIKNEKEPHAGLAAHSATLCRLVNSLVGLRQRSLDETVVLIQSIASLALLAVRSMVTDFSFKLTASISHTSVFTVTGTPT